MKAIGIPQPGAWLVINGYHPHVPLPKATKYRGLVLIYALPDPIPPATYARFLAGCHELRITSHPQAKDFEFGGFLGIARLKACEADQDGTAIAVVESADELGFVSSPGRLGIFNVAQDPFPVADTIRPVYPSESLSLRSAENYVTADEDAVEDDPSLLGHFLEGVNEQAKRELRKNAKDLGRAAAKDAINIGADLLSNWLGGGTPRGGRKR